MRRIYGTGDFEHVNYRFLEEPGRRVLAVDAVEKSWGPDYLRFGLGLSSDFGGDAYFNLLASYRKTWLNSLGAEWRTDVQFGHTRGLVSEFYQPLDPRGTWFVAPYVFFEKRIADIYQGRERIARYDIASRFVGVDLGMEFRQYGTFRLGVLGGTIDPDLDTGPPSLAPAAGSVRQGAYQARMLLDQLDSVRFPRKGWRVAARVFDANSSLGADEPYTKWEADGDAAYSIGDHTFQLTFKTGGKLGSDQLPRYDLFQWGGFLQQSGYATGQLLGTSLQFARAMYRHRIVRGGLLEGAYGGVSLEAGRMGNPLVAGSPEGLLKSLALYVGTDTPIGPVYLGYGRAADGNSGYYFYLGRAF